MKTLKTLVCFLILMLANIVSAQDNPEEFFIVKCFYPQWSVDNKEINFVGQLQSAGGDLAYAILSVTPVFDTESKFEINHNNICGGRDLKILTPATIWSKNEGLVKEVVEETPKISHQTFFDWSIDGKTLIFSDGYLDGNFLDKTINFWKFEPETAKLSKFISFAPEKRPFSLQCIKGGKYINKVAVFQKGTLDAMTMFNFIDGKQSSPMGLPSTTRLVFDGKNFNNVVVRPVMSEFSTPIFSKSGRWFAYIVDDGHHINITDIKSVSHGPTYKNGKFTRIAWLNENVGLQISYAISNDNAKGIGEAKVLVDKGLKSHNNSSVLDFKYQDYSSESPCASLDGKNRASVKNGELRAYTVNSYPYRRFPDKTNDSENIFIGGYPSVVKIGDSIMVPQAFQKKANK